MSDFLQPHELQHSRLPCPSPTAGVYSNSCPSVSDAIQPSHRLLSPSPPAFNLAQHQSLFKWVSFSCQGAKVLELQLQNQSFQWILGRISFRIDWFDLLAVQETQETSPTSRFKSINSSALSFLYGPTLTSIHDYWKKQFDYMDLCQQSNISAF